MRTQACFVLFAFATACALIGVEARAQKEPSAQDKALSEQLFRDAKKLLDAGQVSAACPKFAESLRLEPKLGTLLNLATCHEKEGKTASAWAEFNEALRLAKKQGDDDRVEFAQTHAASMEAKLSRIAIEIAETVPDMVIQLNDKSLSAAAVGSNIPLDPGEYAISVTAPGKKTYETKLTLEAGPIVKPLVIPKLEDGESIPKNSNTKGDDSQPVITAKGLRTISLVTGGVGLLGLGIGAVFGGLTLAKASTAEDNCILGGCNQIGAEANETAYSFATVSNIGFAVGAIGLGAGIAMFILSSPSSNKGENKGAGPNLWIAPSITLSGTHIAAGGRF